MAKIKNERGNDDGGNARPLSVHSCCHHLTCPGENEYGETTGFPQIEARLMGQYRKSNAYRDIPEEHRQACDKAVFKLF